MPKKIFPKPLKTRSTLTLLNRNQLGFKRDIGYSDEINRKLITSINSYEEKVNDEKGGIFNLEFSLDGSILAAACEKKSIVLYDAFNQRVIKDIGDAHDNCVNCIRFLDHFAFASGSDDSTIKLWDTRFLKSPSRTLRGHSNWVKNIEYSYKENRLVTSAFDGSIFSWDLNNYTENNLIYDKVFIMDGLMRTKLTPDGSKMVICTTNGYLLIIHNLNLNTMCNDLQQFKPNLYRLMQISEQNLPIASNLNHLFSPYRKVNRVELVSDFPNEAEVISSLQIHPMGWCALTRNINCDVVTEWTCIHDIQERELEEYLNSHVTVSNSPEVPPHNGNAPVTSDIWMGFVPNRNLRYQQAMLNSGRRGANIQTIRPTIRLFNSGLISIPFNRNENTDSSSTDESGEESRQSMQPAQPVQPTQQDETGAPEPNSNTCQIIQNLPRLTHYIEEPNVGKGFIKELCFSADGRIICSPYYEGIRLFAFNIYCNELSHCIPERSQRLHKLATFKDYHPQFVVSCKFNPYHSMIVSGCLGGKIVWYQPVL